MHNKPMVIFLGAGRPYRGDEPSALAPISKNKCVLDWLMDAFSRVFEAEFHFVAGYGLSDIARQYPKLLISINSNWSESGSFGSLMAAPLSAGRLTYVCYTDVLLRSSAIARLHALDDSNSSIAVDSSWKSRYLYRKTKDILLAEKVKIQNGSVKDIGGHLLSDTADAEFAGVLKISPKDVTFLIGLRDRCRENFIKHGVADLVSLFNREGRTVNAVDIHGEWAELNAPQDISRFVFGTKAETLERLGSLVQKSVVGDQVSFRVGEWMSFSNRLITQIINQFNSSKLAIRSSATTEDGWQESNAGCFTSLLNIPCVAASIFKAVGEVISSYGDNDPNHRVLVQAMVENVKAGGVVFSRTLSRGSPYYVINYDDTSGSTDSVTGGAGEELKTCYVHHDAKDIANTTSPLISKVVEAVRELEFLVGHDSLDVEFAVSTDQRVHLLQLRPIAVEHVGVECGDKRVKSSIVNAEHIVKERQKKLPFLFGKTTYFGVMPDWNPAEIIGTKPKNMALSLYQYLVTDKVWSKQRAEHGYRDVFPHPLIVTLAGHPYIDVRASFNSFIPNLLSDDLASRLVDNYLDQFKSNPHLHDKIEFEIVFTCLSFDFSDLVKSRLSPCGFTEQDINEIKSSLLDVTKISFGRVEKDLKTIDLLSERFESVIHSDLAPLDKASMLLDDCECYGTLPFAHLARAGFIAITLLRSLEKCGVLKSGEISNFLNHLNTVTRQLEVDGGFVFDGSMQWIDFIEKYGHLRPGTYDITSLSYSSDPDKYLKPTVKASQNKSEWKGWGEGINQKIEAHLSDFNFGINYSQFDKFLRDAITGREYSKFIFTRNLSAALECFALFGKEIGMSREDISHVNVQTLMSLRYEGAHEGTIEYLSKVSKEGAAAHQVVQSTELPPVVCSESDLRAFQLPRCQPNFVTAKKVLSNSILLSEEDVPVESLKGKIVLIPRADPGFDWLFGYEICGLITMYGGANSHMTIRAAEMGLPAAIGVGEMMFEQLSQARMIELDCLARQIRVQ